MAQSSSKTNIDINPEDKPVFSWSAREFPNYTKNASWYWLFVLAGVALMAFFIWQRNWAAAGLIAAAVFAIFAQARVFPKAVKCELYRSGIVVNEKAYPYDTLKAFWIIAGEHPVVRFEQTGTFIKNQINVPISDEDPEQVRLFLSKFLPEDEKRGEDVTDVIQRWLRF
jgi:hypothetical protein